MAFRDLMQSRRTVREFDPRPVPRTVIEPCIAAAGTAPSGANQQPWHFVAVSDPDVKRRIRVAAEAEEREFYERRAPQQGEALLPGGVGGHRHRHPDHGAAHLLLVVGHPAVGARVPAIERRPLDVTSSWV